MRTIPNWSVRFEDFVTGEIFERHITEFQKNMICPDDKVAETNEMLIDTVITTIGKMAVYGFTRCAITVCWDYDLDEHQCERRIFNTFKALKEYYRWLIN